MGIKFSGLEKALKRIESRQQKLDIKLEEIIENGAEEVLIEAKRRVPVDTGVLRDSAHRNRLGRLRQEVVFATDYAIYIHEDPEAVTFRYSHPIHGDRDCGGEAWFLKNATNAKRETITKKILRALEA